MSKILDSGDRTQFDTGAVRDMRTGKGRCDLLPLDTAATMIAGYFGEEAEIDSVLYGKVNPAKVLHSIEHFKREGYACSLCEALDQFCILAYKEQISTLLLELAKHFEDGAEKYGENNWQKGIPVDCYMDSAIRHYLKYRRGDDDEPHDRAFVWNVMSCIWEVDYHD